MEHERIFGRRGVLRGLVALALGTPFARRARAQKQPVRGVAVRISRGTFAPEQYEAVRSRLAAAQTALVPALRELEGCLHYYAAIDRESQSMVNVSIWRTRANAEQMNSLAAMKALADEFAREGVVFERPIANYEALWAVEF